MVPMAALLATSINLSRKTQIKTLIAKKTSTKILLEYPDYVNVFSSDLVIEFPEYTEITNYAIDLVEEK